MPIRAPHKLNDYQRWLLRPIPMSPDEIRLLVERTKAASAASILKRAKHAGWLSGISRGKRVATR